MRILVCVSVVPDTTSKITTNPSNHQLNTADLTYIIGPYDDYALSRAIEIKEANGAELAVLHVGNASSEALIRKCLALGADYAVRIDTDPLDAAQVANEIAAYAAEDRFDLILMGKESIDYNAGMVHRLVAEQLNCTHFNPVMHLDVLDDERIGISLETEHGKAKVELNLPAVLGCQEPIAEWKIPSMRGIMAARTKEIKVLAPKFSTSVSSQEVFVEEQRRKGIVIDKNDLSTLVNHLKQEALI